MPVLAGRGAMTGQSAERCAPSHERWNRHCSPRGLGNQPRLPVLKKTGTEVLTTAQVVPILTIVRPAVVGFLSCLRRARRNRRVKSSMPWTPSDAERHTHKAATPALQQLWAKVANDALERTGDEGRAIREANAVVARQAGGGS
jgi:hypothetical protein